MANLTTVGVTSGVPSSGTGTVSTLDNLIGTAGTPSAQVVSVQGHSSGTAVAVSDGGSTISIDDGAGSLTVDGTVAVTQSGNWSIRSQDGSGNALTSATRGAERALSVQIVDDSGTQITSFGGSGGTASNFGSAFPSSGTAIGATDGTNMVGLTAIDTAPDGTEAALVVALSPNGINANGAATSANSAPMVPATDWVGTTALSKFSTGYYVTVAASQTGSVLQSSTGATGDYISGILVIPASTSPGNVLLLDNATSITVFAGGASSVTNLVPFFIPLGAVSRSGAWKITTGSNVSCVAVGKFS